jgi:hypothetical protein
VHNVTYSPVRNVLDGLDDFTARDSA